ncbi:MAG: type II toxin-antitoxin system HigB family toxin [Sulfurovum sp.]|nr:MAG: type II toxin-antitoxin system HigB family toxin [Sulfurovum sp.]
MNVISKRTIVEFYTKNPQSKTALEVWHSDARKSEWQIPNDIKKIYPSASFLADNRVVFNIKGNDYRLIVHIDYKRKIVRVKFIGTHAQYDKINAEEI